MTTSSNNSALEKTSDLHVLETRPLIPPSRLHNDIPLDHDSANTVSKTRRSIQNILHHNDQKLLVIVGPCSIHDIEAAKEYSQYINIFRELYKDKLEIVMRVYFEKPRTTIGWKGLINDPHLDDSYDINTGLRRARSLLSYLARLGIPSAAFLASKLFSPLSISTKEFTLYPPIIVPSISIAFSGLIDLQYFSELTIAVSQLAFT